MSHPAGQIMLQELRILRRDPATLIFVLLMPLLLVSLMREMYRAVLAGDGVGTASGIELAVPGMAVSFAAFGAGYVGFSFFREHGWGTWNRLRASPASALDIVVGKVAPAVALTSLQMLALFVLAVPLFGLRLTGSWTAVVALVLALALFLNLLAVVTAALCRTSQQFNAVSSLLGLALATLGGAFVPASAMPAWAAAVAPAVPTYWAVNGLAEVILDGAGTPDVSGRIGLLLAGSALLALVASARLRLSDVKTYWG